MKQYKVVILTAGAGSRLGNLTKDFNKALLPIGFNAAISRIIEKFNPETEFVIAIGHRADLVKEYLLIAHPQYKFRFVKIDKISGDGAGPCYSLFKCQKYLQCPFIFSSVDTIVSENIPKPSVNWLGVARVTDTTRFNSISIKNGFATNMLDKVKSKNTHAFIGLCGINNYELFWKALTKDKTLIQGELQISNGLKSLVSSKEKMKAIEFSWSDIGDIENYRKIKQQFNENIENFDFSKTDEYIYFIKDRVIKYFKDKELNKKRIERSKILAGFVPLLDKTSSHFLSYKKIVGTTLYNSLNDKLISDFLSWLKSNFWSEIKKYDKGKFQEACFNFYYTKTLDRIKKYFESTNTEDSTSIVNGNFVPEVYELLKRVDWRLLKKGVPTRFHGDLQFDNILSTHRKNKSFILLDWRPDFSGLNYGDLYYDLAKLYGGLILPYHLIKKGEFKFSKIKNNIELNISTTYKINSARKIFEEFATQNNYDLKKIKLITALIFLNMSPLHNEPFNHLLHHLGKLDLKRILDED